MLKYNFEILTPLIMGGAERGSIELREGSIKGILRWWFRFYKGASVDLKKLKEEENIWGSQKLSSRIKIVIENKNLSYFRNNQIYYAYLCMNDRRDRYSQIKRVAFHDKQSFCIKFSVLYPTNVSNIKKEIENTLFFLTNFGGFGARWRRGFGSVIIKEFQIDGNNIEEIALNLNEKLKIFQFSSYNPDFINLSNTSIYLVSPKNSFWNNWENAMNELRDNLYRELKKALSIREIAIGSPRKISPLIIQIKRTDRGYYGVLLIWKNWKLYTPCVDKLGSLNLKIQEVIK